MTQAEALGGKTYEEIHGPVEAIRLKTARSENMKRQWADKELKVQRSKAISEAKKGKTFSEEHKRKLSEAGKRKILSEETKRRISKSVKGKNAGENNGSWQGGISNFPYAFDFNDELKRMIRERDNYTCQFCGIKENGKTHGPHHIDYDKMNSNLRNLILLCGSCNIKANATREKWELFFTVLQEIRGV